MGDAQCSRVTMLARTGVTGACDEPLCRPHNSTIRRSQARRMQTRTFLSPLPNLSFLQDAQEMASERSGQEFV